MWWTSINDQGLKSMVSVPVCVWANEMTFLHRIQVRKSSISDDRLLR